MLITLTPLWPRDSQSPGLPPCRRGGRRRQRGPGLNTGEGTVVLGMCFSHHTQIWSSFLCACGRAGVRGCLCVCVCSVCVCVCVCVVCVCVCVCGVCVCVVCGVCVLSWACGVCVCVCGLVSGYKLSIHNYCPASFHNQLTKKSLKGCLSCSYLGSSTQYRLSLRPTSRNRGEGGRSQTNHSARELFFQSQASRRLL